MKYVSKAVFMALAVSTLAACVSPQPAGEVSSLSVASARVSLPAQPVTVRWGGTITSIENTAAGTTILEVVGRPLNLMGRPVRNDRTDGRFIAELNTFLDPEIVKAGRDITVTGAVGSLRNGTVGKTEYVFPVVAVADYRYWKPVQRNNPAHLPHPSIQQRYHDDFWHDWPHSSKRELQRQPHTSNGAQGT